MSTNKLDTKPKPVQLTAEWSVDTNWFLQKQDSLGIHTI